MYPGVPTTIKTMGVKITNIAYLSVLIIEIGSTIILVVVEAHGEYTYYVYIYRYYYHTLQTSPVWSSSKGWRFWVPENADKYMTYRWKWCAYVVKQYALL